MEKYKQLTDQFFDIQREAYELSLRIEDNMKQIEKGQPSLDTEDTGERFKND